MIGYLIQAAFPSRITDTVYCGRYCKHSLVHRDDLTGKWGDTLEKPKRRSQLSSQFLFNQGKDHTINFSLCFPNIQERITVMDLHSQINNDSPFYIVANGESLIFRFNGHGQYNQVLIEKQWIDLKIETDLIDYFRLYVDNDLVIDEKPEPRDTVNFKIGCYEFDNNWTNPTRQVYFQI
jgi:hypothetical protein